MSNTLTLPTSAKTQVPNARVVAEFRGLVWIEDDVLGGSTVKTSVGSASWEPIQPLVESTALKVAEKVDALRSQVADYLGKVGDKIATGQSIDSVELPPLTPGD